MSVLIKDGRVVDPGQGIDSQMDILVDKGVIVEIDKSIKTKTTNTINATGKIVAPGFIDMHTHLREPGHEDKETIETGLKAALGGGFTTVCAMPNTEPACDSQAHVKFLLDRAREEQLAHILPVGAITKNRAGEQISEMKELKDAGCPAISDDGSPVEDSGLMRIAMEYASMVDLVVISHCEDQKLAGNGVMREGYWSTVLGLKPIPAEAESTIVDRDIRIAELAGTQLHIAHISTAESVEIVCAAKKRGVNVTAEVTPHHFTLTDEDLRTYNTNMKVNPPIGTRKDVKAIKQGIKDGTIDVIATDHAPHMENEKEQEFDLAPFGMIGLETALSLSVMELLDEGILDWSGLIKKFSTGPAHILGCEGGSLAKGTPADIVLLDPDKKWKYTKKNIRSRSNNSPFIGREMKAAVTDVLVSGKVVLRDGKFV